MAPDPLEPYRRRYQELAAQVVELGFVAVGSLIQRVTVCTHAGCRCHGDPPQPHGPYYQWTRKVANKTVTRRLTAAEAERYAEWIANGRRLRQIVAEMEQVSAEAIEVILHTSRS